MATPHKEGCPLCQAERGVNEIWRDSVLRVIEVEQPGYPGYMRVIWHDHVAEMTDLMPTERVRLMETVYLVEETLREAMGPDKINLAALGNMVPHLHWHIIPRWRDDPQYPDAIWAPARRDLNANSDAARRAKLPACHQALLRRLRAHFAPT